MLYSSYCFIQISTLVLQSCSIIILFKNLGKNAKKAAIWILGAFKTSSLYSIKLITRLVPINLYLQKLRERLQLQAHSLPLNHLIHLILESSHDSSNIQHPALLNTLTSHQHLHIKSHLIDINNRFNGIFPSFTPLHPELSPSLRIIDNFSDHISFNLFNKEKKDKIHLQQLDNMVIKSSTSPSTAIIVTDASIKNNVAISILHMHITNNFIIKTLYHAVHVTSTEVELFAIRCSIN